MNATSKIILGLVLVVVVAVGGWWAFTSQSDGGLANLSENAGAKLTDAQIQQVVERVGSFMVLPADETPTGVVLRDVATLAQQQSFYKDAKDGDVLLVYSSRAIIYDVQANKLVSVSPITRNDATPVPSVIASGSAEVSPSASVAVTPAAPEKVTIDVRNGTTTAGLAGSTASDLKKNSWVTIGKLGDAKGSYKATVLVDLSKGTKPGAVAALEKLLGVTAVSEIPKGEQSSTADILVIVGK